MSAAEGRAGDGADEGEEPGPPARPQAPGSDVPVAGVPGPGVPAGGVSSGLSGSAGDVVQAGNIGGDVHFHQSARHGGRDRDRHLDGPAPRQLPNDTHGFVNRSQELERLDAVLAGQDGTPLVVSVHVIAGTAGVGKTSLALRWAHRVHQRHFPDGQLYVNLRGYDPGTPVTAQEALHRFLLALHVPPGRIPADPDAAAALYRSTLAGRRMLVVLDNAATTGQVRPLLPGAPGCLVLVTSRSRLSGLAVRDGARRLTLGTLGEAEAVALLRAVTADYRPQDAADKLEELARLCARLPLALRIAAERAASRPLMQLEELIRDLRDESLLWSTLTVQDEAEGEAGADAVRTVFAWSYRALPADAARLFRCLGAHPGPEFGVQAAAALSGVGRDRTRQQLDVLVGAHLLEQTAPDRFEFHDLLRAYATDQAQQQEPPEECEGAVGRVLDWYLHAARAAQAWINPHEVSVPLGPPAEGVAPPSFAGYEEALLWYELESANLLAAARKAEAAGLDGVAWRLPAVLRGVHMVLNPFEDWLTMAQIGLDAARREGDRRGEAELLESLGMACTQSHRLTEGAAYHEACLAAREELGDRMGVGLSLNDIGLIRLRERQLHASAGHFEQSLVLFEELDERHWAAVALTNLAEVRYQAGELTAAGESVEAALAAHRESGDRGGEGNALRVRSAIERERGNGAEALRAAEGALEIALGHRNHMWEGYWLLELGGAQRAAGRPDDALVSYQRAAVLQRRLGDRSREARAWYGAGQTYAQLGRTGEAAGFLLRAAAVQRELGDGWQLALALDGLATAVRERPEPEPVGEADAGQAEAGEASAYWEEALRALDGFDDPRADALRTRIGAALGTAGT